MNQRSQWEIARKRKREEMRDTHTQTATLRIIVRKGKEEQEQDDITHSEMAAMTVPEKEKGSIYITVILLMRWHSVALVFKPFCRGSPL